MGAESWVTAFVPQPVLPAKAGDGLRLLPTEVQTFGKIPRCSRSSLISAVPAGLSERLSPSDAEIQEAESQAP